IANKIYSHRMPFYSFNHLFIHLFNHLFTHLFIYLFSFFLFTTKQLASRDVLCLTASICICYLSGYFEKKKYNCSYKIKVTFHEITIENGNTN
ncbi:hypothetical protein, partial [Plasmodium yoelii yoelii]